MFLVQCVLRHHFSQHQQSQPVWVERWCNQNVGADIHTSSASHTPSLTSAASFKLPFLCLLLDSVTRKSYLPYSAWKTERFIYLFWNYGSIYVLNESPIWVRLKHDLLISGWMNRILLPPPRLLFLLAEVLKKKSISCCCGIISIKTWYIWYLYFNYSKRKNKNLNWFSSFFQLSNFHKIEVLQSTQR